jgi:hypothetical protein
LLCYFDVNSVDEAGGALSASDLSRQEAKEARVRGQETVIANVCK